MSKLAVIASMLCTMTALPQIFFREKQTEEAKPEATKERPKPPELAPGQTAKFDPFNRAWRVYTPKQPKYRVVFDTDEIVYLERRYHNAQLTEARNELLAMRPKTTPKNAKKYQTRARIARAEADACASAINERKARL